MVRTANLCILCKGGRNLCGLKTCPLLARASMKTTLDKKISTDFFGKAPSVFIGRFGYPKVFAGPMGALETNDKDAGLLDNPRAWYGMDYSKIIEMRSSILRSKYRQDIHYSKSRFIDNMQELALAKRPTDIELQFRKKPTYVMRFSDIMQPMGPSGFLEQLKIAENPRISRLVDKVVSDELKAYDASYMLYKGGEDVYKITTILSSGALGRDNEKKLVPTRWSITAMDDTIAKHLMEQLRNYPSINEFQVYESQYLDNHFLILLMPGNWEFENFECWAPGSFWSKNLKKPEIIEEYEPHQGRKTYAELQGGGYYSSRLAVAEHLSKIKRQARVVVFREVYEGYIMPLGVWVVRQTARNAFENKHTKFSILKQAIAHIDSKLRMPVKDYVDMSKILRQQRLTDFSQSHGSLL